MKALTIFRMLLGIHYDPDVHAAPGPTKRKKKRKTVEEPIEPPKPNTKAILKSGKHLVAGSPEGDDKEPWVLAQNAGMLEGRSPLLTRWDMIEFALKGLDADKGAIIKPYWAAKMDDKGKKWSIARISRALVDEYGKGAGFSEKPISEFTGCFSRALLAQMKERGKKAA